jgi:hypothetical protein
MSLKPKEELFAQALIKHQGHQTNAYLELHPHVKEPSARANASRLLANVSLRKYIAFLLYSQGLGIKDILKRLKELSEATRTIKRHDIIFYEPIYGIQLQAVQTALRIYEAIGYQTNFTLEQTAQMEQMIKDFEGLDQKQGNNS